MDITPCRRRCFRKASPARLSIRGSIRSSSEYRDGGSQRSVFASTSRKRWRLAKRLTAAQLAELRAFYQARKGSTEPFYFYDPWETNPKFTYDPTGGSPVGRYTVRFQGSWSESAGLGRAVVQIELTELA